MSLRFPEGPYQIDLNGDLRVPELGTMHVAGTSLGSLVAVLTERCHRLLKAPAVHVSISEYRSQRMSILGAVATPGVQQIGGRKTLFEAISDAGGLKQDAGGSIQVSRRVEKGPLPIVGSTRDASGRFETGHVDVHDLMQARTPATNVVLQPNDVITVPRAELVYVLGTVRKPGGFELVERQQMSVMQALSLAGGAERTAGTRRARILHPGGVNDPKTETPVDLARMIAGKLPDIMLRSSDILIVPDSARKAASLRMLEALLSTGTGVAICGTARPRTLAATASSTHHPQTSMKRSLARSTRPPCRTTIDPGGPRAITGPVMVEGLSVRDDQEATTGFVIGDYDNFDEFNVTGIDFQIGQTSPVIQQGPSNR